MYGTLQAYPETKSVSLDNPFGAGTGEETAIGEVDTTVASGTIWSVIQRASIIAPSSTEVLNGQNGNGNPAADAASRTPTITGTIGFTYDGLVAGASYQVYFYQEDVDGNTSSVVGTATFTTFAIGTSRPASTMPNSIPADEQYAIAAPTVLIGDPTVPNGDGMVDLGQIPAATVNPNPTKAMGTEVGGHNLASEVYDRGVQPNVSLTINDTHAVVIAALMSQAEIPNFKESITSVDTTADTVTIAGDYTAYLSTDETIKIVGSTGNDGTYTVASVSLSSGDTVIAVDEAIGDSTADGEVRLIQEGATFPNDVRVNERYTVCIIPNGKEQNAVDKGGVWWLPAVAVEGLNSIVYDDSAGEDAQNPFEVEVAALRAKQDQSGDQLPKGAQTIFSRSPGLVPRLSWSIVAVDTSADTVEVSGDKTSELSAPDKIEITGSTGNDGIYTVTNVAYDVNANGNTTITVSESIGDSTADGSVIQGMNWSLPSPYNTST